MDRFGAVETKEGFLRWQHAGRAYLLVAIRTSFNAARSPVSSVATGASVPCVKGEVGTIKLPRTGNGERADPSGHKGGLNDQACKLLAE